MAATITKLPVAPAAPQKKKPRNAVPDGRKRVRALIGVDPETGKKIYKAFYGKTLRECNEKRDAFLAQREAAAVDPASDPAQPVAAWAERWLAVYGQSGGHSARTTRAQNVAKLSAALGDLPLRDVRQLHVQTFASGLAAYSKSTVLKIKQTTQQIFRAAVRNDLIRRDPTDGVVWQHAGEGTHRYLEAWEIRLITSSARQHHAGTWAMLMLYAGLRRGEALALRWEDVDLAGGVLHVRHGVHFEANAPVIGAPKTASAVRDVPLLPVLADHLRALPRRGEYICTGASGQQVTESIWSSGWRAYNNMLSNILAGDTSSPVAPGRRSDLDAADRPRVSIRAHDLRHTFASMLYDAGVDIKTAQRLLGHSSPEITMAIYTHLSEAKQSASLDKLAAFAQQYSTGGSKVVHSEK